LELILNEFDIQRAQNGSGNNTVAIKVREQNDGRMEVTLTRCTHAAFIRYDVHSVRFRPIQSDSVLTLPDRRMTIIKVYYFISILDNVNEVDNWLSMTSKMEIGDRQYQYRYRRSR
jgi:hypothetical protein